METALITGASGGIGYELAKIFARNKINTILVARNEKRLQEVAEELEPFGTKNEIIVKDLSDIGNAISVYNEIKAKGVTIDYVINNAGYGINESFINIPWEKELNMYNLNMISLAYFTKVYASDMKQRGKGKILNVGSTASFQPGPYMAGYCATKAFVLSLSEAVNYELKGTGVSVTTLCPGVTDTGFIERANAAEIILDKYLKHAKASDVAEYGYKIMMKGKSLGIHSFFNKVLANSSRFSPRSAVVAIAGKMMKK